MTAFQTDAYFTRPPIAAMALALAEKRPHTAD